VDAANVVAIVQVVVLVAVAWRISTGGGGTAVQELTAANKVLADRLHEERQAKEKLGGEVRDLRVLNQEISARTDFAAVMELHERNDERRHVEVMALLAKIRRQDEGIGTN